MKVNRKRNRTLIWLLAINDLIERWHKKGVIIGAEVGLGLGLIGVERLLNPWPAAIAVENS